MDKKYKILIIDNIESIKHYESLFENSEYGIIGYDETLEIIDVIKKHNPHFIIIDIANHNINDDVELCQKIRSTSSTHYIPIIIVSGQHSQYSIIRAFESGIDDFIVKPFNEQVLIAKIKSILTLNRYGSLLNEHEKLKNSFQNMVKLASDIVKTRDLYTAKHQEAVGILGYKIAKKIGLDEEVCSESVKCSGILHDIGKVRVPFDILNRPSRLTKEEMELVKLHCMVGYDLLCPIDFQYPVAQIVLQHHERLNGSGYPAGLTDKDILKEAKILAVADVMDAMSHHRPHRPALGEERAIEELVNKSGILYDPESVNACIEIIRNREMEEFSF